MSFNQTIYNTHGTQQVGTLTKAEWEEARAAAPEVHVVSPERHHGGEQA